MNLSNKNYSLRGLLIILVVIGHLLSKNPDFIGMHYLYLTIYTFHMPLFLILSGYYGYNTVHKPYWETVKSCLLSLLVPFVIVSLLYIGFSHILLGDQLRTDIIKNPSFAMWFILALIFYRLVTKLVIKIPNYLVVVFIISLVADYFPEALLDYADFPRILSFMIYYFIGVRLREVEFDLSRLVLKPKLVISLFVACCVIIAFLTINYYPAAADFTRQTDVQFFRSLSLVQYFGGGLLMLGLAVANSLIIYSLLPPGKTLIYIGKQSFNIYLGHIFFILLLKMDWYKELLTDRLGFFIIFVICVELIVIISSILIISACFKQLKKVILKQ